MLVAPEHACQAKHLDHTQLQIILVADRSDMSSESEQKTDHWGELASEIGADVPTEPDHEENSITPTTENVPAAPAKLPSEKTAPQRQPKPRSDWQGLAGELGVEVDPNQHDFDSVQNSSEASTEAPQKDPLDDPLGGDEAMNAVEDVRQESDSGGFTSESKADGRPATKHQTQDSFAPGPDEEPPKVGFPDALDEVNAEDTAESTENAFDLSRGGNPFGFTDSAKPLPSADAYFDLSGSSVEEDPSSAKEEEPPQSTESPPPARSSGDDIPSFTFNDVPTVEEMDEVLEQANVREVRTPSQESAFDLSIFDDGESDASEPEKDASEPEKEIDQQNREESSEKRPRRRRRRGRKPKPTGDENERRSSDTSSVEETTVHADSEKTGDSTSETTSGDEEGARPGRRRRRRRGRKSDRSSKPTGDTNNENERLGYQPDEFELFEASSSGDSSGQDDVQISVSNAEESGEERGEDGEPRVAHRKIPSWDETIGVVVDANLASRGKTERSKGRGRRRGGPRREK